MYESLSDSWYSLLHFYIFIQISYDFIFNQISAFLRFHFWIKYQACQIPDDVEDAVENTGDAIMDGAEDIGNDIEDAVDDATGNGNTENTAPVIALSV